MAERTITISGLSKTYSVTGWRLAYVIACERLTGAIRKVYDFLADTNERCESSVHLIQAGATAAAGILLRGAGGLLSAQVRDAVRRVERGGAALPRAQGAYYIMADLSHLGFRDDFDAAEFMLDEVGIAAVPGSSFYHRPELGKGMLRFTFSKSEATIARAAERLEALAGLRARRRR